MFISCPGGRLAASLPSCKWCFHLPNVGSSISKCPEGLCARSLFLMNCLCSTAAQTDRDRRFEAIAPDAAGCPPISPKAGQTTFARRSGGCAFAGTRLLESRRRPANCGLAVGEMLDPAIEVLTHHCARINRFAAFLRVLGADDFYVEPDTARWPQRRGETVTR